ncbi:diaminopimelate epimerase [Halobacteriovorax sp. HLS]|uniref:diaminopimelate epimerase n=1 Tax=Halobacteriovorax sp. HLS TaxID=2234000 RepID=UPI000FD88BBA|nr:diaminopimelate epimerase [Halobacteriovorax sp. HLS]
MSSKISFEKYCATGNDFVVVDNRTNSFDPKNKQLWQKVCDRRFGVGADGVLFFNDSSKYDFEMVYLNADGGEVGMCGNGARALTTFASKIQFDKRSFSFKTRNGVYESEVLKSGEVKLQMTELYDESRYEVSDLLESNASFFVNTGVAHSVFFVDSVKELDISKLGSRVRYDERFVDGCNANFVQVQGEGSLALRTYERGVEGETLACGTGAVASAIAYRKLFKEIDSIGIKVMGGELRVLFEEGNVFLCGKAQKIFSGVINIE